MKFIGDWKDISDEEFIYRITILTTNTLGGDMELLCKNEHMQTRLTGNL